MSTSIDRKPLRVWPGVVLVVAQWLVRYVMPAIWPDTLIIGVIGGVLGGALLVFLWWTFFSRAPWLDRLAGLVLAAVALAGTKRFVDISIATGAQGMMLYVLSIPGLCLAFVAGAAATRNLSDSIRRVTMATAIVLACGFWTLIRTGGFTAGLHIDLHWRWTPTPEERLVATSTLPPAAPALVKAVEPAPKAPAVAKKPAAVPVKPRTPAEWPGFRGPHHDGIVAGLQINTDWKASPPSVLWKRPIGPGWSSFAVQGDLIYTQEQRGPDEVVACYRLSTGEPVWAHRDGARFWESNGGPGPRGTPTLSDEWVYTFGATGIVNALDASSGSVVWSRNAATEASVKVPTWGFSSSPLVTGDLVVVGVGGRLAAYDRGTGAPRWMGPAHGTGYSSPRLVTIDGVDQVVMVSSFGVTSVNLADGKVLWEHAWKGYPIVQPGLTAEGDVLVSVTEGSGIRRLAPIHSPGGTWKVEERWTSMGLKPYFNDFVIHKGFAYGFDGAILSCIDLKDGQRKWKGGRYGEGQMILLADSDLLLLTAEEGDLALVRATPDQYTEIARIPAIEGKTWNHPAIAGNVLLVRNGEQMAAFRLAK